MSYGHSHTEGDDARPSASHSHSHDGDEYGHTYAEANRQRYGKDMLEEMAGPLQVWGSNAVADGILKRVDLTPDSTVLDFACGSGIIAHRLIEHARKVVGVDLSQDMVDGFNLAAEEKGIDHRRLYAIQRESLRDAEDELDGEKFDLVVCSQAFHHVEDLEHLTRSLARRLKLGGKLIVTDIDSEADFSNVVESDKKIADVVAHKHGFSRDDLIKLFEGTGLLGKIKVEPGHSATFGDMRALGEPHNMAIKAKQFPDTAVMKWIVAVGERTQ